MAVTFVRRALLLSCCLFVAACQSPQASPKKAALGGPSYTVYIDRDNNGAASDGNLARARIRRSDEPHTLPRILVFEMAGQGTAPPAGASQEARVSARQAAVIDAFGKALVEARRWRNQPASDFVAKLGPRLTVSHRSLEAGCEFEIRLVSHGTEHVMVARNGKLMHPPCDIELLRRVFTETNGEFSLLTTELPEMSDRYAAIVGCYMPAVLDTAVAGGLADDGDAALEPSDPDAP